MYSFKHHIPITNMFCNINYKTDGEKSQVPQELIDGGHINIPFINYAPMNC